MHCRDTLILQMQVSSQDNSAQGIRGQASQEACASGCAACGCGSPVRRKLCLPVGRLTRGPEDTGSGSLSAHASGRQSRRAPCTPRHPPRFTEQLVAAICLHDEPHKTRRLCSVSQNSSCSRVGPMPACALSPLLTFPVTKTHSETGQEPRVPALRSPNTALSVQMTNRLPATFTTTHGSGNRTTRARGV